MKCKEVMTTDPKCCVPTDSVTRVAKLMKTEDIGSLPVCEDRHSHKLIGIITDRDLVVHVLAEGRSPNNTTVQDVMTRQSTICHADDDLEAAIQAMERNQVRRLPVLDREEHMIGIIAQADIATRLHQPQKTAEVLERISQRTIHA